MNTPEGVVSQLNAVWDRKVAASNVTVVLAGSEVATMSALAEADSPLYGRLSWRHRLEPFGYRHTAEMVPHLSRRAQLYVYGIFGGMPRYPAAIRPDASLADAVKRTVLSRRGEVHLQLETVLKQERGIRDHAAYRAVLAAVTSGATGTNELSQKSGLNDSVQTRRALETLENLGLMRREQYFEASRRAGYLNRIDDHAVDFWYRFVEPNRSQLELDKVDEVWEQRIEPYLDQYMGRYMGRVLERVAAEAFAERHNAWGLPSPTVWRRWEGQDRNRRQIELDIVSRLDDGSILTGEVKWSSAPIGAGVHDLLPTPYSELPPLRERAREGHAVGVLEVAADRDARRDAGNLDVERLDQLRQVERGRLAVDRRRHRQDDLLDLLIPRLQPEQEFADVDVVRPDPFEGADQSVEDVIGAAELAGVFDGPKIRCRFDHADGVVIALGCRADVAEFVLREVAAARAEPDPFFDLDQSLGEIAGDLFGRVEDEEG